MADWAWTAEGHCVTLLSGITPAALITALRGAEPDALGDLQDLGSDLTAAGFTLAERITGVSCSPEFFERAAFAVAVAALPG